jgi:hypothetical protein
MNVLSRLFPCAKESNFVLASNEGEVWRQTFQRPFSMNFGVLKPTALHNKTSTWYNSAA